ncbi:MAG: SIMPL domain-containing protein [Cyanobacteriota bacterium]
MKGPGTLGDVHRWGRSLGRRLGHTPPLVLAMAVLALGLIIASDILVKGLRSGRDSITVTGASTERIRSDAVDWSVDVGVSAATQQQSYRALQPLVQRTRAFLLRQGIQAGEMELGAVRSDSNEVRDPRSGTLVSLSWTSRQTVKVNSRDVDRIQRISGRIGTLIGEGVPLTINPPAYTFTHLAEKRVEMLAKATRDARERAVAIAREAGSSIGPITNADTGSFQITVPDSTDMNNSGSYDTTTINKDITAVMAVTFRVQ